MRFRLGFASLLLFVTSATSLLDARVLRVEIASRHDVLNGKSFSDAGAYERITGRIYFSVPVSNPHNLRIVDLERAVNLKNGEVEFSADFIAIRPKDSSKSNGSLLLEIPNRGRGRIVGLVDGGDWDLANDAETAGFCATVTPSSASGGSGTQPGRTRFACMRPSPRRTATP